MAARLRPSTSAPQQQFYGYGGNYAEPSRQTQRPESPRSPARQKTVTVEVNDTALSQWKETDHDYGAIEGLQQCLAYDNRNRDYGSTCRTEQFLKDIRKTIKARKSQYPRSVVEFEGKSHAIGGKNLSKVLEKIIKDRSFDRTVALRNALGKYLTKPKAEDLRLGFALLERAFDPANEKLKIKAKRIDYRNMRSALKDVCDPTDPLLVINMLGVTVLDMLRNPQNYETTERGKLVEEEALKIIQQSKDNTFRTVRRKEENRENSARGFLQPKVFSPGAPFIQGQRVRTAAESRDSRARCHFNDKGPQYVHPKQTLGGLRCGSSSALDIAINEKKYKSEPGYAQYLQKFGAPPAQEVSAVIAARRATRDMSKLKLNEYTQGISSREYLPLRATSPYQGAQDYEQVYRNEGPSVLGGDRDRIYEGQRQGGRVAFGNEPRQVPQSGYNPQIFR